MLKRFINEVNRRTAFAMQTQNTGKQLEARVADLLKKEGFRDIQKNVIVKDVHGNRSEIDIIAKNRSFAKRFLSISPVIPYGKGTLYVECKQYAAHNRIELDLVAKFKEVCSLNNIPLRNTLFVTTSTFVPRALTVGVPTVDGTQLNKWARTTGRATRWIFYFLFAFSAIAGMATYIRKKRQECLPYIPAFTSTTLCGSRSPPLVITTSKPENMSTWSPFIAVQLNSPLPTEHKARMEAHAILDAKTPLGDGFMDWQWLHSLKQSFAHITAAYDYIIIGLPTSKVPTLRRHSLGQNVYAIDDIDECMCFKFEIPHIFTVPGYFIPYCKYRWSTLKPASGDS